MFSNFEFENKSTLINKKSYIKLRPENAIAIKGFLRKENNIIYYFPEDHENIIEQKLLDFDAMVGDSWFVSYSNYKVDKFTFVESSFDEKIENTAFVFKVLTVVYLHPLHSHSKKLTYFKVSKKRGIIACYYTGYNGYVLYELYPSCKFISLTYEESEALNKKYTTQ